MRAMVQRVTTAAVSVDGTEVARISPAVARAAHDAFVDFVHGFSLSVPRTGMPPALARRLRAELAIVLEGIEIAARRMR